ncbi:hypothetical protein JTE90_008485 [Oedothorax gibbosus]|uniref:Uncharacterized protein n=1 Tax=Oedothorax gibbosus TaxID=931172 RepID=A0AAV6UZ38_9ARAC|nr:hypothetical protein JTE90_008485 [Oedothorax gibbosus]
MAEDMSTETEIVVKRIKKRKRFADEQEDYDDPIDVDESFKTNVFYTILDSVIGGLTIKTPLIVAIESPPALLDSLEQKVMEECVPLLKPIEAVATELSGEKYPTLSMVIPFLKGLQLTIKN